MRVFVTGASGFVGSAVTAELIANGHEVIGLARSDASARKIEAAGATALRGDLTDIDTLGKAASEADGVAHLAFIHDFSNMAESSKVDFAAITAIGESLKGTDKPFVVTSGIGLLKPGGIATEDDVPATDGHASHRAPSELKAIELRHDGIRSSVVRLPPSTHGEGDHGFIPVIIDAARKAGTAGYIGDGTNRWPSVHRNDAAVVYRRALESAPAGSVLHAVHDEGIPTKELASVIGRHLGIPAASITAEEAAEHYGWIAGFWGADVPATSTATRHLLGWEPTHTTLVEDLDEGHYFAERLAFSE